MNYELADVVSNDTVYPDDLGITQHEYDVLCARLQAGGYIIVHERKLYARRF